MAEPRRTRSSLLPGRIRLESSKCICGIAHTKKLIGQLEEVATGLDSAPDAYHAHWAPDSKHVGITSRADRHWADNAIYRIENRRAYPVKTPELICHAVPEFCQLTKELGGALTEDQIYAEDTVGKPWKARQNSSYSWIVKWISPTRFVLREEIPAAGQGTRSVGDDRSVWSGGEIRGRERRIGPSLSCWV